MIVLQQQSHCVQRELARVLRVTTQAWGLSEAVPGQARTCKLATRTQAPQRAPRQSNWSRVPVQSLRWAI